MDQAPEAAAYATQTDDELYARLGAMLLGEGLGISPGDHLRFQRFAKDWLRNKRRGLARKIDPDRGTAGLGVEAVAVRLVEIVQDPDQAELLAVLLGRIDDAERPEHEYDVAVSFAGEQRPYVEQTVVAARALSLRVFYDKDLSIDWWGKNFVLEQRRAYGLETRYMVPFLSVEYLAKPIPMDELAAATVRAVERRDDYILPVLIGDVVVPRELLSPHIGYLRAEDHTPAELARNLRLKVDRAKASAHGYVDIGTLHEDVRRRHTS